MKEEHPPSILSFLQRLKKQFFHQALHSSNELLQVLKEAEESHVIDSHTRSIIEGTMQLENMEVRDVMVPKSKMVIIEHNAKTKDFLDVMIKSAHSRFPVFNSQKNKIKGVVLAKDLLGYLAGDRKKEFSYKEYLRPSILVPESKTLGALLRDFQQKKSHMAIVMDEYGEIAGLITLEDVLEQIVGEIEDEHDMEEDNIIDFGGGRYLLKANTPLEEFNEFFEVSLETDNADTVAGLVVSGFTYLPEQMSEITLQGFHFKVLKTDSRRLHLLEVKKAPDIINPEG
ncbi:transporter associated domain-containing protein [Candidatus Thioglobus sp.]|jgi:magnesium and cobalt transporter|uniref:HlyC/CorC family transporter n=1 Tax=Candidatus Thioglobus sp. TaxID=2026721 RepID=UPI0001BD3779|nr:transporter associated domain-containing protein [Candidatus Thioglobus sp.]EEZ80132.1 MAG: magnesium/cobalt efflux protein [uncultured Candidatus Thioglobus sp.]MBT3186472.1 CBS domain-containing protein [Candidatus Thioglobus sp.]MBT3965068.1 CBS domain-containing protein [Candidatus Thioglobus sp.]MBT4315463.1 CBS domain-containing protein [Candidatus Thioglobus sp.]MBT4922933.1 CBS domain-containing protein [Candidatus Thioglobus sp.]